METIERSDIDEMERRLAESELLAMDNDEEDDEDDDLDDEDEEDDDDAE